MLRRALLVSSVVVTALGISGCSARQDGELARQLDERSVTAQAAGEGSAAPQPPVAREPISAEDGAKKVVIDPVSTAPPQMSTIEVPSPPPASATTSTVVTELPTVTVTAPASSGPPADADDIERVAPTGTAGEGQVVSIGGVGGAFAPTCAGGEVQISGVENTVTITGHCARLIVSGVDNVIVVDSFTELNLSGVRNHLTYLQGEYTEEPGGIDCVVVKG